MFGHFYHSQLRTYALLMANLFNNISIKRKDKGLIKVPVTYGSKEAFNMKINQLLQKPVGKDTELGVETILPRMNVQLIDVIYDGQAKTRTTLSGVQFSKNGNKKQYNVWPCKITYELNIQTRYQDDIYQIVEQILPYFTPYFIQEIKERFEGDLEISHKVPIEIVGIQPDEQQASGPNERRRLEWSIQFAVRGYLYPPAENLGNIIKTVFLDFRQSINQGDTPDEAKTFETLDYQITPIDSDSETWNGDYLVGTGKDEVPNFENPTPRGAVRKVNGRK